MSESNQEKDFLRYSGNRIPRLLRFVWTTLVVFAVYYIVVNAFPDFVEWMRKLK